MTIASRTPEGEPHRCPICAEVSALEPSFPGGDSCCPKCGRLLGWFRDNYARLGFSAPGEITFESSLIEDLGADALDIVEFIMEVEEKFDLTIPDDVAPQLRTIADIIRYIRRRQSE